MPNNKVHKAEKIARDRLQEKETPAMLAALGDLTQDPECWQRAWDLSGGRYAHAKVYFCVFRVPVCWGCEGVWCLGKNSLPYIFWCYTCTTRSCA